MSVREAFAEFRGLINGLHDRASEAYGNAHEAWDQADDAVIAYNNGQGRDEIYQHAYDAREYAETARDQIDDIRDKLDDIRNELADFVDSYDGDADAPVLIDPDETARYVASENAARAREASAALSRDPLELLRGIADESGAAGAAFGAAFALLVAAFATIAYGAVGTMGLWALAPLAVLAVGLALGGRGFLGHLARAYTRRPSRSRSFLGHHAGARESAPYLAADLIARGLADIAEVGGSLYLFTGSGWRAIDGLTLGAEHPFTIAEDDGDAGRPAWIYADDIDPLARPAEDAPAWLYDDDGRVVASSGIALT